MKDEVQKRWYAVYVAPKAEKKVSERFSQNLISHYLPTKKVIRQWSDRKKEVIVPVINGYIFVNIKDTEFRKILDVYGAIAFVSENKLPVAIPDYQIDRLKSMVKYADEQVEFSMEEFIPGEMVKIIKGPLEGIMVELIDLNGKHKVIVRLDGFGCALTTVPMSFIERLTS